MEKYFLGCEDRVKLNITSLYRSYGYEKYVLSGLDDYSLYAENTNFLGGDIVSVNAGGRLLALRSDVTLSIAKSIDVSKTNKIFYDENVYREKSDGLCELGQIGVEIIGEVDAVAKSEICELMYGTLKEVSEDAIIDISHMGIITDALDCMRLEDGDRAVALGFLERKNLHDFERFAKRKGISAEDRVPFCALINLPPSADEAIAELKGIKNLDISKYIAEIEEYAALSGGRMQTDFSIVGDVEYYNGAIFKGYVPNVPKAVLSGGRYDRLLEKFGKKAEAVGFALYLGDLNLKGEAQGNSPDAVVVYGKDIEKAKEIAERMRAEGKKTLLSKSVPDRFSGEVVVAGDAKEG